MANPLDVSSAKQADAVTKSDSTTIFATRALYVGTTGDVAVVFADGGGTKTFKAVPAGSILPISVTKVMNATTAGDILALY